MRHPLASLFRRPRGGLQRRITPDSLVAAHALQRRVDELREKGFPRDVAIEQATEEEGI